MIQSYSSRELIQRLKADGWNLDPAVDRFVPHARI
jgi:hypothetical protein